MKYIANPITEKDRIINALFSSDLEEFDLLMMKIHQEWYDKGWNDSKLLPL